MNPLDLYKKAIIVPIKARIIISHPNSLIIIFNVGMVYVN